MENKRNLPPWAWQALTQGEGIFENLLRFGYALDTAIEALKAVAKVDSDDRLPAQIAGNALAEIRRGEAGQ